MISSADILAWRADHPWQDVNQVEQDLVLSRALVELFSNPRFSDKMIFRGGTAFHKLFLDEPKRYSEDLDFVQKDEGPIGPIFDAVQEALNPLLGKARRKQGRGVCTVSYRFMSEGPPQVLMKMKLEFNTREHFSSLGLIHRKFEVESAWFNGVAEVQTFSLDELLATKVRALYQRRKGRDLFDLWLALTATECDPQNVVRIFCEYMNAAGRKVDRKVFEENLRAKVSHRVFLSDTDAIIRPGMQYDPRSACDLVVREIVNRL